MNRRSVIPVALALLMLASASAGCTPGDPPLSVPRSKLAAALSCPDRFTSDRQSVLLVHGTFTNPEENFGWNYAGVLPERGYDVCTVRLPGRALEDIQVASEYVVFAVRQMHAASDRRVDILGHSQGGLEPRWALRWWPSLRTQVDDLVTLASPHHGTVVADAAAVNGCVPACLQMRRSARFIAALNSVDETPGPVSYTAVYTLTDELVQPVAPTPTAALAGASNILVQDLCPGRPVDHVGVVYDAAVHDMVIDAFTRRGPADPDRFDEETCAQVAFDGVDEAALPGFVAALDGMDEFSNTPNSRDEPPLKPYARS
ncbi:MAG: lipase [Acidimicrobiia bacterium]|nr:lipase [Acidimicrobiia bacterium]